MLWPSGVFEVWERMIRKVRALERVGFDVKAMSRQCSWYKGGGSDWNYEGRKDVDRRHKVIADIRTPPTAVTNLPLNSKRLYAFEQILCIHNLNPLSCTSFSVRCCGGKIEKIWTVMGSMVLTQGVFYAARYTWASDSQQVFGCISVLWLLQMRSLNFYVKCKSRKLMEWHIWCPNG